MTIGQLTAYRIAGDQVDPAYQPTPLDPSAGLDLAAMACFGSPALTPAELLDASTLTRSSADKALAGSLGIHPQPTTKKPETTGPAPRVVNVAAGHARRQGGCSILSPAQAPASGTQSGGQLLADLSLPPAEWKSLARACRMPAHLYLGLLRTRERAPASRFHGRFAVPRDSARRLIGPVETQGGVGSVGRGLRAQRLKADDGLPVYVAREESPPDDSSPRRTPCRP